MTMKKRKWFIPVVAASVLLIGGITGGLVAANNSSSSANAGNETQAAQRYQAFLDRVCAIYEENNGVALDSAQLQAAVQQARSEMQDEALQSWLQNLVNKGAINQTEADQYLQWWQSRPDVQLPLLGLAGRGPGGGMMRGRGFGPWGGQCGLNASPEAGE
jgi:hypothetical protein